MVELLICNQWVGGSSPFAGSRIKGIESFFLVGFPSGQREQTVNLSATPSEVQILPPPPDQYFVAYCRRFRSLVAKSIRLRSFSPMGPY